MPQCKTCKAAIKKEEFRLVLKEAKANYAPKNVQGFHLPQDDKQEWNCVPVFGPMTSSGAQMVLKPEHVANGMPSSPAATAMTNKLKQFLEKPRNQVAPMDG